MEIITRKEAKEQGLKRYYTGKPCPQGHVSERYVNGYGCAECLLENNRNRTPEERRRYNGLPEPTRPEPTICECCGEPQSKTLNLDHDHETGEFRGWLCWECNSAIGRLGDNVTGVLKALLYLLRGK